MVVCGTSVISPVPATGAVAPVIQPYTTGLCTINPITYQARYPGSTLISTGQIVPVSSQVATYGQGFTTPPPPYYTYNAQSLPNTVISAPIPIPIPYSPTMPTQTAMIPFPTSSAPPTLIPCSSCSPVKTSDVTTPMYNSIRTVATAANSNSTQVIEQRIYCPEAYSPGLCSAGNTTFFTAAPPAAPSSTIPTATILPYSTRICQISPNILTVPTWKQSYGMEQVWQNEFKSLFSQYASHVWLLLPVTQTPQGAWNANVDSAKVRFYCEDCGHGWTSMKGRVAFWFVLNPALNHGVVCLKLYGQQCDRCKTGNYEPAMWYPEEIFKVLVNIYNKVGQIYYGFQQAPYHRTRRPGKPRTPHNSDLCQACKDGVCSERK